MDILEQFYHHYAHWVSGLNPATIQFFERTALATAIPAIIGYILFSHFQLRWPHVIGGAGLLGVLLALSIPGKYFPLYLLSEEPKAWGFFICALLSVGFLCPVPFCIPWYLHPEAGMQRAISKKLLCTLAVLLILNALFACK